MGGKHAVNELAIFGGSRLFSTAKPTSNLARPNIERFLAISREFIDAHQYTNGIVARTLERRLSAFHQTDFCVSFCSGFWSVALAMRALAKPRKTEVVLPSLTYRRMADVAAWNRLTPHFCEVEELTLANSAETVRPCINRHTALILGVHPLVNLCDIDGLVNLSDEFDLPLLFDSVESASETFAGRRVGGFGSAEVFSLGASKLINGFEGGYVTTNDAQLAERLIMMRDVAHGQATDAPVGGALNVQLSEVHAAMAIAAMDDLDDQVNRNRRRYHTYQRLLASLNDVRLIEFDERYHPAYKNIVIELLADWPLTRDETVAVMNAEMALARAYYGIPLHRKPMAYTHVSTELPITERLAERLLILPSGQLVSIEDIGTIVELLGFISHNASDIKRSLSRT